MAKFATLASSSAGNSTYIGASSGAILVDAGISCRRIMAALSSFGEEPLHIRGVLLTHEHIDHIKGLSVFLKKTGAALYGTPGVLRAVAASVSLPPDAKLCPISCGEEVEIAGMGVRTFRTPHDAEESVGYRIETPDGQRLAVATDLGEVTPEVEAGVLGAETILLESNYDPQLLRMGPYPPYLKARIASDHGHLSNDDASAFACRLLESGATRFFLGHLSKENNTPSLAQQVTFDALRGIGAKAGVDFELSVAPYDEPGKLVCL